MAPRQASSARPASRDGPNPSGRHTRSRSQGELGSTKPENVQKATKTRGSKKKAQDLNAVEENAAGSAEGSVAHQSQAGSPGRSAFPHVDGDTDSLNLEDMVRNLPELNRDAERLLDCTDPPGASNELPGWYSQVRTEGSGPRGRVIHADKYLKLSTSCYGEYNDFIPLATILKKVALARGLPELPEGPWRPDEIVFRANLARLVFSLLEHSEEEEATSDLLKSLDVEFPRPFGSDAEDAAAGSTASKTLMQTARIGLEMRTQLFISILRKREKADAANVEHTLAQTFYAAPAGEETQRVDSTTMVQDGHIRGWNSPSLKDDALSVVLHELIDGRLRDIRRVMTRKKHDFQTNLSELRNIYNWQNFVVDVIRWAQARSQILNQAITDRGGASEIAAELKGFVSPQSARTSGISGRTLVDEQSPNARHRKNFNKPSAVSIIKARTRDLTMKEQSASSQQAVHLEGAEADDEHRHFSDNEDDEDRDASGRRKSGRSAFIDAQSNARRMEFETQNETEAASNPSSSGEPLGDLVVSQDQFQNDARTNVRPNVRRKAAAHATSTASKKRKSRGEPSAGEDADYNPDPAPDSNNDDLDLRREDSQRWNNANKRAKAVNADEQVHKIQRRYPWTAEEIEALHEGIRKNNGPKYSKILEDTELASILHRRDQVALKDKCRNIKFDYLRSGTRLPEYWDRIPLNKGMRIRLGIDF